MPRKVIFLLPPAFSLFFWPCIDFQQLMKFLLYLPYRPLGYIPLVGSVPILPTHAAVYCSTVGGALNSYPTLAVPSRDM